MSELTLGVSSVVEVDAEVNPGHFCPGTKTPEDCEDEPDVRFGKTLDEELESEETGGEESEGKDPTGEEPEDKTGKNEDDVVEVVFFDEDDKNLDRIFTISWS